MVIKLMITAIRFFLFLSISFFSGGCAENSSYSGDENFCEIRGDSDHIKFSSHRMDQKYLNLPLSVVEVVADKTIGDFNLQGLRIWSKGQEGLIVDVPMSENIDYTWGFDNLEKNVPRMYWVFEAWDLAMVGNYCLTAIYEKYDAAGNVAGMQKINIPLTKGYAYRSD